MRSARLGKTTSRVEVTNVSRHGFWILVEGREKFVAFQHFPWFLEVLIGPLLNVELQGPGHLYWPDLDVDLTVESIEHPERFPLVSKRRLGARKARRRKARG